ncbi:hypothetical protein ABT297_08680 [Dactylosporangium sp. NPDC000555]|uniref:hypothetical protein n=1 Tax=Dactylosporangium sp. NPDC000555 TaxID=3154260 RepID=UPI0033182524
MSVTPARGRQLSLFGVEARPPAPIDLEGLLAGAGQVGRMGGTGRVSIVVDDAWRCAVVRAELEARGLVVSCEPTGEEDRWRLRTAYSAALAPLAARWLDDEGTKVSPRGLALDGRSLRLWVAAAGAYDGPRAYLLRLAPRPLRPPDDPEDPEDPNHSDGLGEAVAIEAAEPDPAPPPAPTPAVSQPVSSRRAERPNVRKRKGESKITAFDPGPDELVEAEEFFGADAGDEWPDSGLDDLPTVVLDTVSERAPEPVAEGSAEDMAEDSAGDSAGIDRQVADNWIAVGDALAAVGLPAVLVGADSGGPAYRIVGPRRITRLAELVGEPPADAPQGCWPA